MSEYENFNAKVKTNMASRRKAIIKDTNILLVTVLVTIAIFYGLNAITFISAEFMLILVFITICIGAFNAGRIWSDYKR